MNTRLTFHFSLNGLQDWRKRVFSLSSSLFSKPGGKPWRKKGFAMDSNRFLLPWRFIHQSSVILIRLFAVKEMLVQSEFCIRNIKMGNFYFTRIKKTRIIKKSQHVYNPAKPVLLWLNPLARGAVFKMD
jgi:hypothetical protein